MAKHKDYDVGYGKPPKHSRFKKGQSGNPEGRPKRQLNVSAEIEAAFSGTVPLTQKDGRVIHVTYPVAIMMSLFSKGMKGGDRAAATFLKFLIEHQPSAPVSPENDTPEDDEILKRYEERIARKLKRGQGGSVE